MPIYEFLCIDCEMRFEELVRNGDGNPPPCPSCGSNRLARLLSVFTTRKSAEPPPSGAAAGGGCCGGSCGCG